MKTHDQVAELLKTSTALHSLGFVDHIQYGRKGANHNDLIVISKDSWKFPRDGPRCGYKGVYLHFEYERPGFLFLHCELYPRQGSEARHPREEIQPLLHLKASIGASVRETAMKSRWHDSIGWEPSSKDLGEPKNLQVGKFPLGSKSEEPEHVASAIENLLKAIVPSLDDAVSRQRTLLS